MYEKIFKLLVTIYLILKTRSIYKNYEGILDIMLIVNNYIKYYL